jgi:hypothetical protein
MREEIIAIIVVAVPLLAIVARYFWKLGSVQDWIKKTKYEEIINTIVEQAINSTEVWANKQKKSGGEATSSEKLDRTVESIMEQAKAFGVPAKLLQDDVVNQWIESALLKFGVPIMPNPPEDE